MLPNNLTGERIIRMHEEKKGERGGGSSGGRVYINKPREKTPKIIPVREEINPVGDAGDAQGEKRRREQQSRVVPKRRLTGWVLGSKLN